MNKIKIIEQYAKKNLTSPGHKFDHAERVRKWALSIAKAEGYKKTDLVEASALLHDISKDKSKKEKHGIMGAKAVSRFLKQNKLFKDREIEEIANAIRFHDSNRQGSGKLLDILRDADMMDLFGAIGLSRAIIYSNSKPIFNPKNIKGDTWGMGVGEFNKKFDAGKDESPYIIDGINFEISCYGNLATKTAKKLAKPRVKYMKNFILEIEKEMKDNKIAERKRN